MRFPKCGSVQPFAFPDFLFFFFFSPNPEGSDVRRMWVAPPGSGLGRSESLKVQFT